MNEDKTSIEKLANMNLEGLLLPETVPVSYWWLWLILGLLIAIVTSLWAKKYYSPKATALRELKRLHKDLKANLNANKGDTKNIKKQIALSLRQGFNTTRLDKVMPNNMQWREYLISLETAIYSNKSDEIQELSSLIKSAQTWLQKSAHSS